MDPEERAHIERLLQSYRRHLQALEQQAAVLGVLAPPYIITELAKSRQEIERLEDRLRPPVAHSSASVRQNLPPRDYERFVGRQKELAEIRRLLGPRSRAYVVTIDGIGGIGKSALALETAYGLRDQYASLPENERFAAIVWVSAKRSYLTAGGIMERRQAFRSLDDLYAAIAQVLDYPAITRVRAEEQRAIVEDVLRQQRTLLLLDNLETVDDEELLVFLRELPEPTKVVVTTRHRIDVAYPVRLTSMAHNDALDLIRQEAGRKGVVLSAEEREALWQRTGGVPLAIVWSIGLMGLGGSVESVLRRLGQGQSDIARFCFDESVAQIRGRDAHWLLLALGLFAVDANREALGLVAGLGEDEYGRDIGLEDLVRLSLVNKDGNRFALLPLTRSFVQAQAAAYEPWVEQARQRLFEYVYNLVDSSGNSEKLNWQATDQVERELANVIAVFNRMLARVRYEMAEDGEQHVIPEHMPLARRLLRLNRALTWVCRIRGYWTEGERLCLTGAALGKACFDIANAGHRYDDLSKISYFRNDLVAAQRWGLEARAAFQRGGQTKAIGYANRQLGMVALRAGDIEAASELLTQSFNEYQQTGGSSSLPSYLGSMGELAEARGDFTMAENYYQQAIELLRARNNIHNLAADLLNLGRVKLHMSQPEIAAPYVEESLKLAQECGRVDVIARAHQWIGALALANGDVQRAEAEIRQALDLLHRLGMKREYAEAEALLARLGG